MSCQPWTQPIRRASLTTTQRQLILDAAQMDAVPSIDRLAAEIATGSALERLAEASEMAGRLRARGDELLDQFVDAARASGSSWTEIGSVLGTSKQAAQQRFAVLADPPPDQAPFGLTGAAARAL